MSSTGEGFYVAIYQKVSQQEVKFLEIKRQVDVNQAILNQCNGDKKKAKHFGYVILDGPVDSFRDKVGKTYGSIELLLS